MANPIECNFFFHITKYLSPFFMLSETNFFIRLSLNLIFWYILSILFSLFFNLFKLKKFSTECIKPNKFQFKVFIIITVLFMIVGFLSKCSGILE